MSTIYYVYQLIDPNTNQPFYIGKGKGDRARSHLTPNKNTNNPRKDAKIAEIRASGTEPQVIYIFENLTNNEAYIKEEELIKSLGRIGYDENGILTNIKIDAKPPSQKGKKRAFTEEHKRKLSERLKGKSKTAPPWNKGLSKESDERIKKGAVNRSNAGNNHQIGQKYSEDRIEKISKKLSGRKMTEEQISKMSLSKKGKSWEEIFGEEGAQRRRNKSNKLD
jgi:hypothetical protein